MDVIQVIKQSARLAWERKAWWFFGIFLAAGSAGGSGGGTGSGGASFAAEGGPGVWVVALIAVLAAVAIGAALMNIVSEGALIEGVSRGEMTVSEGITLGWAHFGVVLRIKLLVFAAYALSIAWFTAPIWLLALGLIPWPAALLLALPSVLAAVPWLLTLYVVYAFALRIAVLENRHALDAMHKARLFLHGRVLAGLKLLGAMALGHVGVGAASVLALLPVGAVAAAVYFIAGLAPAVLVGGTLALPIALAMAGTLGSYRSSVWTIGYLEETRS